MIVPLIASNKRDVVMRPSHDSERGDQGITLGQRDGLGAWQIAILGIRTMHSQHVAHPLLYPFGAVVDRERARRIVVDNPNKLVRGRVQLVVPQRGVGVVRTESK